MNINEIAKVCHEVNRAYCQAIGDDSQLKWEDAPEWQKQSAINGVTYHLDNPNSTPSDLHYAWMKEKLDKGWKFGPEKDAILKEHPCIVPFYSDLPAEQKAKDYIFLEIVRQLA